MPCHPSARLAGPAAVALVALLAAVGLWGLSMAGVIPTAAPACGGWTGYTPLLDTQAIAQCNPYQFGAGP